MSTEKDREREREGDRGRHRDYHTLHTCIVGLKWRPRQTELGYLPRRCSHQNKQDNAMRHLWTLEATQRVIGKQRGRREVFVTVESRRNYSVKLRAKVIGS